LLAIDLGRVAETEDVTNAPGREKDEDGAPEISQRDKDYIVEVSPSVLPTPIAPNVAS
jgi:hypothetical protein